MTSNAKSTNGRKPRQRSRFSTNRSASSASPIETTKCPRPEDDHELLDLQFEGVQKCLVRDFGHCIELVSLCVKPKQRGKGIGTKLLRVLQGYGKPIWLMPDGHLASDKRAGLVEFYERAGFVVQADNTMLWKPNEEPAPHS